MRRKNNNSVIYVAIAAIAVILIVIAISSGSNSGGISTGILTPVNQQSSNPTSPVGTQPIIQTDLQRLQSESNIPPEVYEKEGVTRFINIDLPIDNTIAPTPLDKANYFLGEYKELIPVGEYKYQETIVDEFGNSIIRFSQTYKGLPVYGSDFKILVNENGNILSFNGGYSPNLAIDTNPEITSDEAFQRVTSTEGLINPEVVDRPELVIYDSAIFGETNTSGPSLAWRMIIKSDGLLVEYVIDASNGIVLASDPLIISILDRNIFDAEEQSITSLDQYTKVMNQSGKIDGETPDIEAERTFEYFLQIYDFFLELDNKKFGEEKITFNGVVNVSYKCPNAYWVSDYNAMYFCKGFTNNIDTVAHEFSHNVTGLTVDFIHDGKKALESAALDESYSDVFAALIDENNPWKISYDKEASCIFRDLEKPLETLFCNPETMNKQSKPHPDHYSDYAKTNSKLCRSDKDFGCSHINSTITTKAAQLLSEGGEHYGIRVLKIGKEKVMRIYYKTVKEHLVNNATFLDARYSTTNACYILAGANAYGITISDCLQVSNAFAAVGIGDTTSVYQPTLTPAPLPIGNVDSSTVMVLDTSGSMDEADITGLSKLQAAQRAAGNILNIASSEAQQSNTITTSLGLVNYNNSAAVNLDLTTDYTSLQNEINNLSAGGGTGMAEGLQTGMGLFGGSSSNEKQMIILLSDGMANIPINSALSYDEEGIKQEVIDLASQAGSQGICVYTIGFGIPGTTGSVSWDASIDEEFLMEVAAASGCGSYYNAQDSIQLANVFVELRHTSMGNVLFERTGQIAQGEEIDLGTVAIPANQELALFTLNWPGSKLELNIQDPAGTPVNENYPGATFALSPSIVSVVLSNPMPGDWRLGILGVDVPEGTTVFNSIVSARVGLTTAAPVTPTPQAVVLTPGSGNTGAVIFLLVAASVGLILFIYVQSKDRTKKAVFNSQLVGVSGLFAGQSIVVRNRFTVGRAAGSNLVLHDPGVSRNHVQFRYANGAWFIQDLGNSAGTYVNGKRVTGQRISNGDQVQIGNQVFTFRVGGQ